MTEMQGLLITFIIPSAILCLIGCVRSSKIIKKIKKEIARFFLHYVYHEI